MITRPVERTGKQSMSRRVRAHPTWHTHTQKKSVVERWCHFSPTAATVLTAAADPPLSGTLVPRGCNCCVGVAPVSTHSAARRVAQVVVLTYVQCAAVKHRCRGAITTAWGSVLMSRPSLIVCTHTHTHAHTHACAHTHTHTHAPLLQRDHVCFKRSLSLRHTRLWC